jgi:AcrR family transcriptional regulator
MNEKTSRRPVERRTRARRGEGELLRGEILDAADELLRATGSEAAVSIDAVAKAVGRTPPAIYLHFADKRSLIREVCERHFGAFRETLNAAAAAFDDPLEALRARGETYVRFGIENAEAYRILFMHRADDVAAGRDVQTIRATGAFDDQVDAVERCIAAGYLQGDAHAIGCALWATAHGLTSLLISKPGFPWPPLETLVDLTLIAHGAGLVSAGSADAT